MASSSQEVASGLQRRLDSKQLPSIRSLGKGLSGFIYETKWEGNKYARKDFPLGSEKCNYVFENEAISLFDLDHPNIVKCFGYTVGDSSCSLLQEYVDDDLQNTIQRRIEAQRNKNSTGSSSTVRLRVVDVDEIKSLLSSKVEGSKITGVDEGSSKIPGRSIVPFDVPEAVDIISQIAAGMKHLHDNGFVHGDLKPKNVLCYSESGAMKVKVADFGVIETKKRIKLVSKRTQHYEILMWKAPERLEELLGPLTEDSDDPFTESDSDEDVRFGSRGDDGFKILAMADVYSFGLTCLHILGGKLLQPDLSLTQLRKQRMHGFRPELPSPTCPDYLRDLIYSCLESEPLSRPTFFNIYTRLKALQAQLPLLMTEAGNAGPMEDLDPYPKLDSYGKLDSYRKLDLYWKLDSYLKLAEDSMEAVQKMTSRKFNNEQCGYLADKLKVVIQSARSFLEVPHAQCHGLVTSVDIAKWVEILKLVLALAKQIESFVQGCCKDVWIQAAMTLTNVPEYVSSFGFNLELCRVAFWKESGSLTLDQVEDINNAEVEIVQKKAFEDVMTLFAKVRLELNSSSENRDLANYLLQKLLRVHPIPASSSWFLYDDGSYLEKLFQWVKPIEHLGKGTLGDVEKAMWLGTLVTKKTFEGPGHLYFMEEVDILGRLCHPNIISTFCYARDIQSCSIIMELMDEDLHDLIQRRRLSRNSDFFPFPILEAVDIMLQIGEGVNYLHSREIVHGDLKSMNILVKSMKAIESENGYLYAKVATFGLSNTKDWSTRWPNKINRGSPRWMPPEIINLALGSDGSSSRSEKVPRDPFKCDTYGFAMVCYEILTGEAPFSTILYSNEAEQMVIKIKRPDLPDNCPAKLKALIEKCWHQEPKERPTFDIICLELKYLKYLLMRGMPTTASDYTAGSMSTMDVLADEVLISHLFRKLPLFDLLRARAVCKRWQRIAHLATIDSRDESSSAAKSYCPLVFKRNSLQHLWCGYDSAAGAWELLPPLTNLPVVDIRPLAGTGKGLMGFKIASVPSQVVVGNPFTSDWQTIPKSTETWGDVGNILVVDRSKDSNTFQIIAVREDATEIYHSKEEAWTKLRQPPPEGLQEITMLSIKDKFISATLCGGLLFCYGGYTLVSFDVVGEKWTEDHIRTPPHASSKCFQMLECAGNLFAAIEDVAMCTITIWGLGLGRREFSPMVEMPQALYSVLCKEKKGKKTQVQLKGVGHKHRMYFWRNFCHDIVVFDLLRRTWSELPPFDQCLHHATDDQFEDFQLFVDTGSFEPA